MADEQNTSILLPIDIEAEMRKSYLDYAMSVIIARALPDVRDGLKPVQRRILVAMNDLGLASNRGYRKCAKICGDTSGNYHPHGEAVIYPALVRVAQDFNMRYPLIDGQGNFGNIDGDNAAAMRYTESRMSSVARANSVIDERSFSASMPPKTSCAEAERSDSSPRICAHSSSRGPRTG